MPTVKSTPWFTVTDSCHGSKFIIRIKQLRRGGAKYVETHKTSDTKPNTTIRISPQRGGFAGFHIAAEKLLLCSTLDRSVKPMRIVWNRTSSVYAERHQHATAIAMHLDPIFLHPRRGRGTVQAVNDAYARQGITGLGGRDSGYAGARRNRRKALLEGTASVLAITRDLEKLMGARATAAGYTKPETAVIRQGLLAVRIAAEDLRDRVFNNKFEGEGKTYADPSEMFPAKYEAPTPPVAPPMTDDDFAELAAQLP